jgi:hypothetical protein
MSGNSERKAIIRAYKEREVRRGVFAVRCAESGGVWIGVSNNLDATQNGLWFTLRMGSHPIKELQNAWNQHGEGAFEFQELEKLTADLHPLAVEDRLKERKSFWVAKLGGLPLF